MKMIREILRLHYSCGLSRKKISKALGCSRPTVAEYINRAQASGLSWPLPASLDDDTKLLACFQSKESTEKTHRAQPDCPYIHQELKKKGVTLNLLWEEYKQDNPGGYQLTQFCEIYRQWRKNLDLVMRLDHKAGEKAFSDFAGKTLPIVISEKTGAEIQAHLFVCTLGASNYTFAKLFWAEDTQAWCTGHSDAFEFFGGCPEICVPDNPKPVVTKASPYEPDINPSFAQMANHFGIAVIPARVRHPKDKAAVECAVGIATRWILAALRKRKFFSLAEANLAVAELLEKLNNRQFKKLPGSRKSKFEEIDKPALKPLPKHRYEFMHVKKATVHIADYHVEYDGCWYSAPFQYRGRTVEIRATLHTLEIYFKGKRIGSHARAFVKGSRRTVTEHRPKSHQEYGAWPPERLVRWAAKIGPSTSSLIEKILQRFDLPELSYRTCFGILRLAKEAGDERLEAACARALAINALSVKSIKSILNSGLDKRPLPENPRQLTIVHENIRGANSFNTPQTEEEKNVDSSNSR